MSTNGSNSAASYTVPLLINGKEVTTSTTFPVVSPSSHETIWHSSSASVDDANAAVAAASAAFPAWSKTKPSVRRNILLKAAEILESRADECAGYMMQETGAEAMFAGGFNIPLTVEMLRDVAGRISGIMGSIPVCASEGTSALVLKEPFGVVLGIAPW
ncbi:aldehyde dehydrogenase [Glonium stellatum]|uniref:Aldehyde dehydrogenase n=1 Tax=Glonium stellatum TaxID=574774 RepID=A0A8E2EYQ7_9PEZI|nr:aldehyde dehydrogenase [Glonium stellatum]